MATVRQSRADAQAAVKVTRQVQGQAKKSVHGSGRSSAGPMAGRMPGCGGAGERHISKVAQAGTGGPGLNLSRATGPMSRDVGGSPPGRG